jgi:hypothetical protein
LKPRITGPRLREDDITSQIIAANGLDVLVGLTGKGLLEIAFCAAIACIPSFYRNRRSTIFSHESTQISTNYLTTKITKDTKNIYKSYL